MNRTNSWLWLVLSSWIGIGPACSPPCVAAEPAPGSTPSRASAVTTNAPSKPAWLTDLSLGLRQNYDDNVFLSGVGTELLPPAYVAPPGSAVALADLPSWVTTISPRLALDAAPRLGVPWLKSLALGYAPDFAFYYDTPSEDYSAHRVPAALKLKSDSLSLTLDNSFAYVNGDDTGPFYPGGYLSAIGIVAPRERREQIQDRAAFAFTYSWRQWFVRPAAALLYYDLMTRLQNVTGYLNFVDRYDVNGGVDLGYNFTAGLGASVGYRRGHQFQQQLEFSPYYSSSDYHRLLLGLFGKPWNWLEFSILAGPDFRSYPEDTPTGITPVSDKHPVSHYLEAGWTASLTPKDRLVFSGKQFLWVSSTAKIPYFDSCFSLAYRRRITDRLGLELGGRLLMADYNIGIPPASLRDDWQYSVNAILAYDCSAHASLTLAYGLDLGRNAQDGVTDPETREYNRNLVSLGAVIKF